MDPDEGLARIGSPMAQQARFDMVVIQRFAQQGIVLQVEHPDAQIVGGAPVGVDLAQLIGGQ